MFVALTVATSSGPPSKGGVRCFSSSSRPTALNHGIAMHLKRQNGEGAGRQQQRVGWLLAATKGTFLLELLLDAIFREIA
ncbi:hypothetical protein V1477_004675 [Vespula maculifrons]|uniref:Uncharacterized protein n=2 Tax=Vespula TaxID=7451 RepID=A0A834U1F4_VESGE|nr:hypothetical protein HZH68_002562 [Vespula germanica]